MNSPQSEVAVVGSGIAGLTAAYALRTTHRVTLFEADDRFGGHAHTHDIDDPRGPQRIDTGFIVHNDRNYPELRRLLRELGVRVHPTEMSMSIRCDGCGLEYAGGRGSSGIFAQRRNVVNPRFWRLLTGVKRFQAAANRLLDSTAAGPNDSTDGSTGDGTDLTLGGFLDEHGFDDDFIAHYAVPVVSCVWSSGSEVALEYPARYLFEFLRNHGFLTIGNSPTWFTVSGGSRSYVDAATAAIGDVRAGTAITSVARTDDSVELTDARGDRHRAAAVVIATHPDQALAMLASPTGDEKRLLGSFDYSPNRVLLHRDPSVLPRAVGARAAWNFRMADCRATGAPVVSYWMNKLQGLDAAHEYLVTLNDPTPGHVVTELEYAHPVYTARSVAAQRELAGIDTGTIQFAGAWRGWGFHEDGCRSGLAAARALGATW